MVLVVSEKEMFFLSRRWENNKKIPLSRPLTRLTQGNTILGKKLCT